MREEIVGKRYAKALIKLGKEENVLERIREDLSRIVSLFNEQELFRRVMCDPVYGKDKRKEILIAIMEKLGISALCQRFLHLLVDKARMRNIPAILDAYMKLEDEAAGRVRAHIFSAYPLQDRIVQEIRKVLEARLHKEVVLEVQTQQDLIGGIVCKVNGMVFDGSVVTQLESLKSTLRGE